MLPFVPSAASLCDRLGCGLAVPPAPNPLYCPQVPCFCALKAAGLFLLEMNSLLTLTHFDVSQGSVLAGGPPQLLEDIPSRTKNGCQGPWKCQNASHFMDRPGSAGRHSKYSVSSRWYILSCGGSAQKLALAGARTQPGERTGLFYGPS